MKIDRREFLSGVVGVAIVPFAQADGQGKWAISPSRANDPQGDWTVDDMCGAYPPYAHPIPFGRPQAHHASLLAHADPADHIFLA